MTMKLRKVLSAILCIAMVLSSFSFTAIAATPIDVDSQEALNTAITEATEATTINLADGTYTLLGKEDGSPDMVGKEITFKGGKGAVLDLTGIIGATWHTQDTDAIITFDGVTVKWNEDNEGYQGLANAKKVVYKGCDIYGTQFMGGDADFEGCTFYAENTAEKGYAVYGRGAGTLTFADCDFYTDGRALMLFQDQTTEVNVEMTECNFYDNGNYSSKAKAVVETGDGSYKTSKFNITFTDCTYDGFEENGSTSPLWGNKDNIPYDRLNVVIDGVDVTVPPAATVGGESYGTIDEAVEAAKENGEAVELPATEDNIATIPEAVVEVEVVVPVAIGTVTFSKDSDVAGATLTMDETATEGEYEITLTKEDEAVTGFTATVTMPAVSGAEKVRVYYYENSEKIYLKGVYDVVDGNVTFTTDHFSTWGSETVGGPWAEAADTAWYTANTKEYKIATAAELAGLAQLVNGGNNFKNIKITLTSDIDLEGRAWSPIGTSSSKFAGHFDGGNCTISNLVVNQTANYAGLFGSISGKPAVIENIKLNDVSVYGNSHTAAVVGNPFTATVNNCHVTGLISVDGYGYVGGIAGQSYGNITDCSVKGESGSKINCRYWGSGGIVGHYYGGELTGCDVSGLTIVGNYYATGGIAGLAQASTGNNMTIVIDDVTVDNCTIENNGVEGTGSIVGTGSADLPVYVINYTVTNTEAFNDGAVVTLANGSDATENLTVGLDTQDENYVPVVLDDYTEENGKKYYPIKSGSFEKVEQSVLAEGFAVAKNDDGSFTVEKANNISIGDVSYTTLEEAINNAAEGATIALTAGTYTMPGKVVNKNITITGNKSAVIEMLTAVDASGSTVNFNNVTVKFDNDNYEGLQHSTKVTYTNCTHIGTEFLYATDVAYTGCTFEMYNETTEYAVWTYGAANVDFTDCVFNTNGKAILVYNESKTTDFVANVDLDECEFNSNGTYNDKAAVELGQTPYGKNAYNLSFNDCVANNFAENPKGAPTGSTLWGNKNSMNAASGNGGSSVVITENGVVSENLMPAPVYVAQTGNTKYESIQEAIDAAAAGQTVTLLDDITIAAEDAKPETQAWVKADDDVIIDLNGNTVTGAFFVEGKAKIMNGSIKNESMVSCIESTGDLTLENVNAISNRHGIRISGGKAEFISGTYQTNGSSGTRHAVNSSGADTHVIIHDGVTLIGPAQAGLGGQGNCLMVNGNKADIYGGTFIGANGSEGPICAGEGLVIYGGTFEDKAVTTFRYTNFLADKENLYSKFENGVYTVAEKPIELNGKKYISLQEAIDDATDGTTLVLSDDITELGTEVEANSGENFVQILGKNITIDFGGNTLTGSIYVDDASTVKFLNGTITTLEGNASSGIESVGGNIELTDMTVYSNVRHAVRVKGGTAVINSGEYTTHGSSTMHALNISHASDVTIKDGVFTGNRGYDDGSGGNAVMIQGAEASVKIEGGTFQKASGVEGPVSAAAGLVISGGTFEDPGMKAFRYANHLVEGKEAAFINSLFEIHPERKYIIEASKSEVKAGETFTVTVSLDGTALYGAEWELVYDKTLFKTDDETSGISYGTLITKDVPVATYTFEALPQLTETDYYTFTLANGAIAQTNSEAAESIEPVPEVVTDEAKVKILLKDFEYDVSVDNAVIVDETTEGNKHTYNTDFDGAEHTVAITSVPDTAEIKVTVNEKEADVDALKFTDADTYVIEYTITQIGYAPVEGTFTFTIDTPKYVVELNHDYVANDIGAKTLVLVYTDSDDISFNYDGAPVFDVTYKGYKYNDGSDEGVAYAKVYAIAVDYAAAYVAKVKVVYKEADAKYLLTLPNPEFDLTRDGKISISDVTSAYAVYNADPDYFINYMKHVLTADVVADKKVNGGDTGAYVKAYTDR